MYNKEMVKLALYLKVNVVDLANLIYSNKIENYYSSFEINKKSGGKRKIHAPKNHSFLSIVQKNLNKLLTEEYKNINKGNIAHGFVKGRSIITNSKVHINKKYVLNLDLKDFFDSFNFGRVRGYFNKNKNFKFSEEMATLIAKIVCYNGVLPQGASTSPTITNLICQIMDFRISKISKKYKLDYTRYADDLTFSTNDKYFLERKDEILKLIKREIEKAGFEINEKKTRLQFKNSRQTVTGVVVNKKINIDNRYYKETRAMVDSLYKTGKFYIDGEPGTNKQLEGRLTFINQFDKYNNKRDLKLNKENIKHDFYNLNKREKTYQKFLIYKTFFINDEPLIVTEGKTDGRYINAALKKFYRDYPNLIEKMSSKKFRFKYKYLSRSKKLRYFLNVKYGGDNFKNIYKDYYKKNNDTLEADSLKKDNEKKIKAILI